MSNYPFSFDNNITLPGVSGSTQEDVAIMALRSAVFAIETELGVTPSGVYPDVRTRLDILEARIQNGINPNIPNDGYVKSPLYIWNVPQSVILSISDGYGAPTENRLDGSLYMRGGDGYANNQLYVRLSGQWLPVQTEQFTATHDLAGFPPGSDGHLAQTVVGLYNHPFNPTMDTVGATQDGYHVTWNNNLAEWEAQTGFIPTHDLAAFSGPYGRTGQIVTGIQNSHVSPTPPLNKQSLIWVTPDAAWVPQATPIVFSDSSVLNDGYTLRTNLISNRLLQAPSATGAGKIGMVNFGSRSIGATTGVTDNYGIILGGDRLQVSGSYGIAIGGDSNTVSGQYGVVVGGLTNTASQQYATILNGTNNLASQVQAVVIDGYSNSATAINSFVLNGGSNTAGGSFSGILNGISNTITAGALHAGIGWGQLNSIGAAGISSIILGGSGNQVAGQNSFVGTSTNAHVASNFVSALNGIGHTIGTNSDHSTIISGNTHTIANASGFAFIGAGNNLSATGLYATILNSTGGSVNGLHALILNGNSNSVTAGYSTIVNGLSNTISGGLSTSYATIVDGYSSTISGAGSFIGDGYSHTISGQYSSILNGNFNNIAGRNSTILNGGTNSIDVNSGDTTILGGAFNQVIGTTNVVLSGSSNVITSSNNTYVLGSLNTIQSTSSKVIGSGNTIAAGGSLNRIFGNNNIFGANLTMNSVFGNANIVGPAATTHDNIILGTSNIVDGFGTSIVVGQSNIATANLTNTFGQYGNARMFGQQVLANGRFTGTTVAGASIGQTLPQATINVVSTTNFPGGGGTIAVSTSTGLQTVNYAATTSTTLTGCTGGTGVMSATSGVGKIGEIQWSRLILDGYSTAVGAVVPLQLQDSILANPTFVDGYSYDMSIKVLIVNTSPIVTGGLNPDGIVPARYYIDVLAHKEVGGPLVLDNVNYTLSTPNTKDSPTRTPWTLSLTPSGNQLILQVDAEVPSSYVQPANGPSLRRAMATIDMREISRT